MRLRRPDFANSPYVMPDAARGGLYYAVSDDAPEPTRSKLLEEVVEWNKNMGAIEDAKRRGIIC